MQQKEWRSMRVEYIPNDPDALLNEIQSAALLGFSPRALQQWRQNGLGPHFVKISARAIRYRRWVT